MDALERTSSWPELPLADWQDTYATLHRCMQIVGKIRVALTPRQNHFWNAAFHLTARGLTSRPMPIAGETFEIRFDFVSHNLIVETSGNERRALALVDRTVADFYRELYAILAALHIEAPINDRPVEIPGDSTPFHEDRRFGRYSAEHAYRFFCILRESAVVFEEFRAGFVGKCSPVHFFWGSFDLAVTRFSGRRAPVAPGVDQITAESYTHEVISAGFWPGDSRLPMPAYYCYAVPSPTGFAEARVAPAAARYMPSLGEFILPYDDVRASANPREMLLGFLESTYEAGADLARWDRAELERRVSAAAAHVDQPPTVH